MRLAEIDTPERRQPYGSRAREALADLAFQREVRVVVADTDRYGRTVGHVYAGTRDVNAEMVRRGAAWVYDRYNRDPKPCRCWRPRPAPPGRGLWGLPEAERMPPWEWRRRARAERDGEAAPLSQRRAAPG